MCLSLYDYQSKVSRSRKRLAYLKNRVTTNRKHTIESQKTNKKREHKHDTKKKKNQNTKGKRKRKGQRRNIKSTGKQGLKWQ